MSDDTLKQWQQDVADYGDNAYQMWRLRDSDYCFTNNADVKKHFCFNIPKWQVRKQSAALPFDLERARDNCEVEAINPRTKQWETVKFRHGGTAIEIEYLDNNQIVFIDAEELRMKFPPKVTK